MGFRKVGASFCIDLLFDQLYYLGNLMELSGMSRRLTAQLISFNMWKEAGSVLTRYYAYFL